MQSIESMKRIHEINEPPSTQPPYQPIGWSPRYVYMCVKNQYACMCAGIDVYVYVYVCVHPLCLCICICICICTCICICIYAAMLYMYMYMSMSMYMYVYVYVCVCICMDVVRCMHVMDLGAVCTSFVPPILHSNDTFTPPQR